ncbi:MAG: hypothetical protein PHV74_03530 [Dehalococcoidia bacterium]|nr:hypothetical protein [Dehalococcoidia bacterium]
MALQDRFAVDAKGKKIGVIVPLKEYQKLMEDIYDLALIAEQRSEKTIGIEEIKRRWKKDGLQ